MERCRESNPIRNHTWSGRRHLASPQNGGTAAKPFATVGDLLAELAGIRLSTKRIERSAKTDGGGAAERLAAESSAIAHRRVGVLPAPAGSGAGKPPDKPYIAIDGTGVFIGSGTIEAGCKAIIGQRLKLSGMRWNIPGATAILTLRCQQASNHWEHIWTPPAQPDLAA